MPSPSATVVIATRNRREDLRRGLASVLNQSVPLDVLVIDGASEDGTAEIVRTEYPSVRLEISLTARGAAADRNFAFRLAKTPYIVSLDDDATLPSRETVAQALGEFDDPRIGAVSIPDIDVYRGNALRKMAPADDDIYVTDAYIGGACVLRRDVFLGSGGFREQLFMVNEESDQCIRMLQAGYVTRLGRADPAHHFESPRRDYRQRDILRARNNVLYAWYNVPMPYLPVHLLGTSIRSLQYSFRADQGHPEHVLQGLVEGYVTCPRQVSMRHPISPEVYRLSRILRHRGPLRLREIEPLLPPRRVWQGS